jgi:hypothetical protein
MPTNIDQPPGVDADVVRAADALIAALARHGSAIDAADDAMRMGQRPEPYRSLSAAADQISKEVTAAALALAALPALTEAGMAARGRALFAWFEGRLDLSQLGSRPDPEDALFRALVGDVLRVSGNTTPASCAA